MLNRVLLGCFVQAIVATLVINTSVYASTLLEIDKPDPSKHQFNQNQELFLTVETNKEWNLSVALMGGKLLNSGDPNVSIEGKYVNLVNGNREVVFTQNQPQIIDTNALTNCFKKNYSLQIKNYETFIPGIYTGTLQFKLETPDETFIKNHEIQYNQQSYQQLVIKPKCINITVNGFDATVMGHQEPAKSINEVFIKSNSSWKLIIIPENVGHLTMFYLKIAALSSNCYTKYLQTYTNIIPQPIVVATGDPTVIDCPRQLEFRKVDVGFMFKNLDTGITSAGNYNIKLNYQLAQL